jgi:outer membrane protein TolC
MRLWWRGSLFLNRRSSRKLEVLILGLALLAEGCLLGPNFKVPPVPVADKWVEEGNKAVDSGLSEHREWWTVFNDPVLTRLVDLAYQQNLALRTPASACSKRGRSSASLLVSSIRSSNWRAQR